MEAGRGADGRRSQGTKSKGVRRALDPGIAVLTKPFAMDDLAREVRDMV